MWLDYAGIRVSDLDRSLAFYTGLLELSELRRGTMDHGGVWVLLHHRHSRQYLELNWYPEGSRYATPYVPGEALDHIGISVRDAGAAYRHLLAHGARATSVPPEATGGVAAYALDPDDHWIELFGQPDRPPHLMYAALRVTDLDRALRFYTTALGLRELHRGDLTPQGGGTFVLLRDPFSLQRLELDWYPTGSRFAVPYVPGDGLDHLGIRAEDAGATARRLESLGARLIERVTDPDGRTELAFLEDPDGIGLELIDQPDSFLTE